MARDLKVQAEESLTENDVLFIENFQRCYINIPKMLILYADQPDRCDKLIKILLSEFKNEELSIYQFYIVFTCFSMMARRNNLDSQDTSYFKFEMSSKKFVLNLCVDGSLKDESKSIICVLRRAIDANTISLEVKGRYEAKYKADKATNKSYIRSLLDINFGLNKDSIHKLKVLDITKTCEGILYSQIAYYSILRDSMSDEKLDKKRYIVDTLINFAIVNNSTISKYAIESLVSCALTSAEFFQRVLFSRLCRKMMEFDESFHNAEREKSSDFVLHPHKVMSLGHLIRKALHGAYLNSTAKAFFKEQAAVLDSKALLHFLI